MEVDGGVLKGLPARGRPAHVLPRERLVARRGGGGGGGKTGTGRVLEHMLKTEVLVIGGRRGSGGGESEVGRSFGDLRH